MIKVKGHNNLRRDPNTGAILNINTTSINKAKLAKQQRLRDKERLNNLEAKIERIESLLLKLVDKND
jgi:hypothetical protein